MLLPFLLFTQNYTVNGVKVHVRFDGDKGNTRSEKPTSVNANSVAKNDKPSSPVNTHAAAKNEIPSSVNTHAAAKSETPAPVNKNVEKTKKQHASIETEAASEGQSAVVDYTKLLVDVLSDGKWANLPTIKARYGCYSGF
jgi:hypothetical protein